MSDEKVIVIEEVEHSAFGASSAARWVNCPGSNNLIAKVGDAGKKSGMAADEGTAAHKIGDLCLSEVQEPWEYIGYVVDVHGNKFDVTPEMADAVQVYVDFVRDRIAEYEAAGDEVEIYVEKALSSFIHEDAFGTSDCVLAVIGDKGVKKLDVVDYKHGQGVSVEPDAMQMKYYGHLTAEMFEVDSDTPVTLRIAQPRIPHGKGLVRSYETTAGELSNWFYGVIVPAIEEAKKPNAHLAIGEWCRFCPARALCPAQSKATNEFDAGTDPVALTDEEIGRDLQILTQLMARKSELEKEAFKRATNGSKVPGFKLVRQKANRTWKDGIEEKLKDKFGDDAYEPPKLKTPPNIEKLPGGKQFVSTWAYKPDTGFTLAPESDKREEVKPAMEEYMDQEESQAA